MCTYIFLECVEDGKNNNNNEHQNWIGYIHCFIGELNHGFATCHDNPNFRGFIAISLKPSTFYAHLHILFEKCL